MKKGVSPKKSAQSPLVHTPKKHTPLIVWLVAIVVLTIIAYLPVINNSFTNWDDNQYITTNTLIRSLSFDNIITIFKTPQVMGNYHPLTIISLAIDYNLFQLSPEGYYIHSLLLHILSAIVLFYLVQALFKQPIITIITTVLFAIHPMHVESVAWASERKDQLYVLYYLAGMLAYLYYLDKNKIQYAILVVLCFVLSLLSKGQAVTFPIALFIIDYIRAKKVNIKDILLFKAPLIVLSILSGITAIHAQQAARAIAPIEIHIITERLVFACYGLGLYLIKLGAPVYLSAFYPYPDKIQGSYSVWVYAGVLAPIVLCVLIWLCRKQRIVVSGILFFTLNIILLLQLLQVGNAVIAERYTYLAYIGLFWALGYGIYVLTNQYTSLKTIILSACAVYAAWLTYACYNRASVWYNSETLWKNVIEQYTNVPVAYNDLAGYYKELDNNLNTKLYLDKAIALQPHYLEAHINRCIALRKLGKVDSALIDGNTAVHIDSANSGAHLARGVAYAIAGKLDSALVDFNWILNRQPDNVNVCVNRGNVNAMLNRTDSALKDFDHALTLQPDNWVCYGNRAKALCGKQRYREAVKDATTAIEHMPGNGNLLFIRAQAYNGLGDYTNALHDYTQAKNMGITVSDKTIADITEKTKHTK